MIKVDLFRAMSKRPSQLPGLVLPPNYGWGSILSFVSKYHWCQRPLCRVLLWLLSTIFLAHVHRYCLKAGAVGHGFSTQVELNAVSLLKGVLINLKVDQLLNVLNIFSFFFLKKKKALIKLQFWYLKIFYF